MAPTPTPKVKTAGATRDTVEAKAEAGFLLAEQYLFQINKPERALEQYRKIEQDFTGTPWAAKAIVAQAWVLSRKLDRKAAADSLFWIAVREHPATEAQLAARDYLEMEGAEVPADLIQLPARQLALADTLPALTLAPEAVAALGSSPPAASDSLGHRAPPTALMPGAALMRPPDPLAVGPPLPGTSAPPLAVGPPAPGTSAPPLAVGPPAPGTNAPPAASGPPAASSSPAASGSPAQATAGPPYASGPPAAHGPQAAPAPPPGAQVPPPARPPAAGSSPAPGSVPPVGPLAPAATTGAQPARDSLRTAPRDTTTAPAGPRKP